MSAIPAHTEAAHTPIMLTQIPVAAAQEVHWAIVAVAAIIAFGALVALIRFVRSEISSLEIVLLLCVVVLGSVQLTNAYNSTQEEAATADGIASIESGYGIELLSANNLPSEPRTSTEILVRDGGNVNTCTLTVDSASTYVLTCTVDGKLKLIPPK